MCKLVCPLCGKNSNTEIKLGSYKYYICSICGLGFVPKFGTEEKHLKEYLKNCSGVDKLDEKRQQQYEIDSTKLLSYLNTGHIMDIGCSSGGFTKVLIERGNFDSITALDVDSKALDIARNKIKTESVEFIESNIVDFQFSRKYDAIIFRGSFQYLGNHLVDVMKGIKNALKENGYLLIYSMPNNESFIFNVKKENWNLFNPIEHKLFFNRNSLEYLASKFKLTIEQLNYPYINTVYCNIERDYKAVEEIVKNPREHKDTHPPFWGNIIEVIFKKGPVKQTT